VDQGSLCSGLQEAGSSSGRRLARKARIARATAESGCRTGQGCGRDRAGQVHHRAEPRRSEKRGHDAGRRGVVHGGAEWRCGSLRSTAEVEHQCVESSTAIERTKALASFRDPALENAPWSTPSQTSAQSGCGRIAGREYAAATPRNRVAVHSGEMGQSPGPAYDLRRSLHCRRTGGFCSANVSIRSPAFQRTQSDGAERTLARAKDQISDCIDLRAHKSPISRRGSAGSSKLRP